MVLSANKLKKLSFLVYGLGLSGKSVIKFFKKNNIKNYSSWDDEKKLLSKKKSFNLANILKKVNYIVLSPGVSLNKSKNKNKLKKYKKKIITDIDLLYLFKKFKKSIVVTGTNGKSTTCKILDHVLKKNNFRTLLGGNIGTPALELNVKKDSIVIIEASSFQLAYSKFIRPDYALLLNISNDHLDWHGNMQNYKDAKFRIFKNQKQNQYAIINNELKSYYLKKNFLGKLLVPKLQNYQKIKSKIKNLYLKFSINDENMSSVYTLIKLLKIKQSLFLKSLNTFSGLPHRYEVFLRKKNCVFINDSKATTFQASKLALKNSKNIFWIVGGLPKKDDKFNLTNLKKNIVKSYIIGKNVSFFKNQIRNKLNYKIVKNLNNAVRQILKDIKISNLKDNKILLSPASASFDQFLNFEHRGDKFKKISRFYARRIT